MKQVIVWFVIVAGFVAAASAQEFRASIGGEITDATRAAIVAATVAVTNTERGTTTHATTNESGRYLVQFLLPGMYTVTAEKPGFRKVVREGITLAASDRLSIDLQLEVGSVADAINVTGEAPLLQTETASRTSVIDNRTLENVPSGSRNLYSLQYTQPGVVKTSNYWGSMELYAFGNVNGVMIGGGVRGENETVIDGVTNTRSDRGVAFVPSLNSTQEMTIQTNSYDAQFGRVGGGVTLINVKSGTNSIHGQLFEFLKHEKLRSNDWIANKNGEERTKFRNSTFGFEFDGPVYIPKVFDGRNRAFFMISLEGLRERFDGGQVRTLPLAEQLRGDFSNLRNDDGELVTIYDPLTTKLGPDGKTYVREPFLGNVIPSNRINPVAAKVASFYPAPTGPGDGPSHADNYANFSVDKNSYDSWLGKMDFAVTDNSRVSFRYGQTPWSNWAKRVWGTNAAEPSNEWPSTRVSRNWGADWTYTLSPALIFNLRGGLARYEGFSGNVLAKDFDPRQLGFPSSLVTQFTTLQFPRFNFQNYSEIGTDRVTSYETHDTWSLQPNMSWIRGRHSLKYGAEFRKYNDNNLNPGAASGIYNFDAAWTQANPLRADAASGNDFASFLLGYPSSTNQGRVDRNIDPAYSNRYYALFVQDDFKVTSTLTLNLGLRWDYETPRQERFNRMIRGFGFNQPSPIASQVQGLTLTGGLLYAGVNGVSRYAFETQKSNFQPRIGVAWQFRRKWVMRGGYGLSYLGQSSFGQPLGFSRPTPLVASLDAGLTPVASLSDPFPSSIYPGGLLQPIGNTLGLATNLGQGISFQYVNRPLPYAHQYSFGLQRELPGNWLVDVSYVGNITKRLPVPLDLNFIPLTTLQSLPVEQRASYFTAAVPNPMAGLLPGSSLNGSTIPRRQLLYAYPQYASVQATDVPIGQQRYDSVQMKGQHRFTKGLSLTMAYTISKALEQVSTLNQQDIDLSNLLNTKLEKRLVQFDVPQKFSVIGTYDLPFGRHRSMLSNMHPVLNGVLGGWTFSGEWVTQSGFPFNFPNAAPLEARSAKLSDSQRDELARQKGRQQFDPSYDKWFDVTLFPRVSGPAPYTLRTFPTRFPDVRSKPLNIADVSLYKEFPMTERMRLQLRLDGYNVGNFPWFSRLQSNDVTNSRFGQLTADMGNEVRVFVGVLKLVF